MEFLYKKYMNKIVLVMLSMLFTSCSFTTKHNAESQKLINTTGSLTYLDIIGDNALDTILIENFSNQPDLKFVKVKRNNIYENICIVKLRNDNNDNIYLEANKFANDHKGLRLKVRNTSFIPDYDYLDLEYSKKWKVTFAGRINTNKDGDLKVCVAPMGEYIGYYEKKEYDDDFGVIDVNEVVINFVKLDSWICN